LVALLVRIAAGQQAPFQPVPSVEPDSLRFGSQLAEFEAKDISGRVWRPEDLRGKFTVVYVWHTFAARIPAPGLGKDIDEIQRFYEKGVKGAQVLTFCRDYDYTHAGEYMKERGYGFPVIADWKVVDRLFPKTGTGTKWVVDPDGRVSYPFHTWTLGRVMYEVERVVGRSTRTP
jgi:hypothetical protein